MANSLSILADNLAEGLRGRKCKSCLEYIKAEDTSLIINFFKYNKSYRRYFNKDLLNKKICKHISILQWIH